MALGYGSVPCGCLPHSGFGKTQDSEVGGQTKFHPSLCSPQRPNDGSHQFSFTDHQTIKIFPYWRDTALDPFNLPNVLACPKDHSRQPSDPSRTTASVYSDSWAHLPSHLMLFPLTPKFMANATSKASFPTVGSNVLVWDGEGQNRNVAPSHQKESGVHPHQNGSGRTCRFRLRCSGQPTAGHRGA